MCAFTHSPTVIAAFFDDDQFVVWLPVECYNTELDISVFVTHELVHGLHYIAVNDFYFNNKEDKSSFSRQLITEGLATYLTREIRGLTEEQSLWGAYLPKRKLTAWCKQCQESLPELKQFAKEHYNTTDNGNLFFAAADEDDIFKNRAGYFLGLRLIEELMVVRDITANEIINYPRHELEQAIFELL